MRDRSSNILSIKLAVERNAFRKILDALVDCFVKCAATAWTFQFEKPFSEQVMIYLLAKPKYLVARLREIGDRPELWRDGGSINIDFKKYK